VPAPYYKVPPGHAKRMGPPEPPGHGPGPGDALRVSEEGALLTRPLVLLGGLLVLLSCPSPALSDLHVAGGDLRQRREKLARYGVCSGSYPMIRTLEGDAHRFKLWTC